MDIRNKEFYDSRNDSSANSSFFLNGSTASEYEYFKQFEAENKTFSFKLPSLPEQTNSSGSSVQTEIQTQTSSVSTSPATYPIVGINNNEEVGEMITVNGVTGVWINKLDSINWAGPIPLSEYAINEDPNPEIIRKKSVHELIYNQEIAIRYLRPPTPPPPGDIIIKQEPTTPFPPAPPLVIRQQPPRPETPAPIIIREMPPKPPDSIDTKVITIPAKRLPPPPRKLIVERLPPLPSKPQSIIIERWLPYKKQKRRVVFANNQNQSEQTQTQKKDSNIIIQWESPKLKIKKEFQDLGVIKVNPNEYIEKFGTSLKTSKEIAEVVKDYKFQENFILASDTNDILCDLVGDVHALSLIDLEKEGLQQYRPFLNFNEPRHIKSNLFDKINNQSSKLNSKSDLPHANLDDKHISIDEAKNVVAQLSNKLGIEVDFFKSNELIKELNNWSENIVNLEIFKAKLKHIMRNFKNTEIF